MANDTSAPVRAVARVGAGPQPDGRAPRLVPRRRQGRLGAVTIAQLLFVELALVLVLVMTRHPVWMLVGAGVITVAVLILTFFRAQGRWGLELMVMRRRYRRRRHTTAARTADLRLSALNHLVAGLSVATVSGPNESQVGIGRDGSGWFAAIVVSPSAGLRGDVHAALPLAELARVAEESEAPGTVVQVVTHTVPAPNVDIDRRQPSPASYQQLAATNGEVTPADQVNWVAVRLDTTAAAEVVAGGADTADIQRMLCALVLRAGKAMKRAGLTYQVLNADGLLDALARSCALEETEAGEQPRPAERWTSWHSGALGHVCYWVRGWPKLSDSATLLRRLSCSPSSFTSVSISLQPNEDGADLQCLARVAAPPELLPAACVALERTAASVGASLFRLDGEQAPAVYASAPSGGGSR